MDFNLQKMKGVTDRLFTPVKIPLHKSSSYSDAVSKCAEVVWGNDVSSDYHYCLADRSGSQIPDTLSLTLTDGSSESLPWTLSNYLQVSGTQYPSRMWLYIMRRLQFPGILSPLIVIVIII